MIERLQSGLAPTHPHQTTCGLRSGHPREPPMSKTFLKYLLPATAVAGLAGVALLALSLWSREK